MLKAPTKNTILELLLLAMVLWVAHFWYFRARGLYEDDYAHISGPLGWQLPDMLHQLNVLVTWPEGRPLAYFTTYSLAFVGGHLGGLGTIYIIGFLIQATNAFLFYILLSRLGYRTTALLGAMIFGLYPAVTTHPFLNHSLEKVPSFTFLLIASHCYLSDKKTAAHVISVGCLLTYESPYLVFLAIPLLCRPWDKKMARELIRHAAVWLGILLAVLAVRALLGEGRIEAAGSSTESLVTIFKHTLAALAIGPAVSLAMFWNGPWWTVFHWNRELTLVFVGCLPVMAWILSRVAAGADEDEPGRALPPPDMVVGQQKFLDLAIRRAESLKLPITALIMLILSYGLSFLHFPPTVTYGRVTSVHLAGAFGGALLFAWICSRFLALAQARHLGILAIALVAAYLSLVVAYRFSIQQDFNGAWRNEQWFWSSVLPLAPDLTDGTIIFVMDDGLPRTRFIETNSWADAIMLEQIYRFPADWKTPPRLFVVPSDWTTKKTVVRGEDQLLWEVPAATWNAHWEVLPNSNVILMEVENGRLARRYGSIRIHRISLHLKPLSLATSPSWPEGTLYPLLVSPTR